MVDFERSEVFLLHETVMCLDRMAQESILPPYGVTYADCLLLIKVKHLSGSTQQELADSLNLGKSSLSQRIAGLMERKLLKQEVRPENRREKRISLTAAGKKLTDQCETALLRAADSIFDEAGISRANWRAQLLEVRNRFQAAARARKSDSK